MIEPSKKSVNEEEIKRKYSGNLRGETETRPDKTRQNKTKTKTRQDRTRHGTMHTMKQEQYQPIHNPTPTQPAMYL
jgi:hypothetical protein